MPLPGITDEQDVKRLLKRLLGDPEESLFFSVVARAPKDGELLLSKKQKFKRKDVKAAAEADAAAVAKKDGSKPARQFVIVGECRLAPRAAPVLRAIVYGKAEAKAVSCLEHLLVRGPYKTLGFAGVILEEVEESDEDGPTPSPVPEAPPTRERGPESPEQREFEQRLRAILPTINAAGSTPWGKEARQFAEQAGVAVRKLDFTAAKRLLDRAEKLVKLADPQRRAEELPRSFNDRLKKLLPSVQEVAQTRTGGKCVELTREAGNLARQRDYPQANTLLDKVDSLLPAAQAELARSSDPAAREEQFRADWQAARKSLRLAIDRVQEQLEKLADALLDSNDANMTWVAEQGLTQLLGGLRASAAVIDKSAGKSPARVAAFARPALAELNQRLNSPQVAACDKNQFGVKVTIKKTITAALDELNQALDAATD